MWYGGNTAFTLRVDIVITFYFLPYLLHFIREMYRNLKENVEICVLRRLIGLMLLKPQKVLFLVLYKSVNKLEGYNNDGFLN